MEEMTARGYKGQPRVVGWLPRPSTAPAYLSWKEAQHPIYPEHQDTYLQNAWIT